MLQTLKLIFKEVSQLFVFCFMKLAYHKFINDFFYLICCKYSFNSIKKL